ncbi:hypothetical protein JR338_03295 [Chloroflexota bacterium]|nr:hypothetical protein JR338_03295 [Chloroflexota bacterium]
MNRKRLVRKMEVKFWDTVTPLMDENGPILKTKKVLNKTLHSKAGFLGLLILVWSAVGFTAGMVIGKVISLFPG